MFNNPGDGKTRHTFLFKAVVETEGGVETGAKLSVAFPDDGQTETAPEASLSDVWTNDALGKLYSQYMVDVVNQDMETKIATGAAGLSEGVFYSMWLHNTLPPVDETALVDDRYNEFVTWIAAIKSGLDGATDEAAYIAGLPNTAKSTATDVRAEEIEFIEAMAADNGNTLTEQVQWFYYLVHELTTDDAYPYSDANTYYTGQATAGEQLLLWLCSYLPSAFQAILTDEPADPADPSQADDYHVSESHLRSFLSLEATDVLMLDAEMETGFNYLKALFESISYIINPAFYVAGSSTASNFVGTYDETAGSEQFYAYTPGSGLAPSSDETAIQDLKLLDLSAVADLVPADESVYFDGFDSPRL